MHNKNLALTHGRFGTGHNRLHSPRMRFFAIGIELNHNAVPSGP